MAKRPKGTASGSKGRRDRAAEREAEHSQAAARERRQTRIILGVSTLIAAAAVAIVAARTLGGDDAPADAAAGAPPQSPTEAALADVGVAAEISGCAREAPTDDPVPKGAKVVESGTTVDYPMVPPSAGSRLAEPVAVNTAGFYDGADVPPVEALMANLYEGWTVLWFDASGLDAQKIDAIRTSAEVLRKDPAFERFVAVEWTPEYQKEYGQLPGQIPIALTRWTRDAGAEAGHRAYCIDPSGEAFQQFVAFYNAPLAPPPGQEPESEPESEPAP